jgi:hemolysin D
VARRKKSKDSPLSPQALEYQPDAVEIEKRPVPGVAFWSLYLSIALIVGGLAWASLAEVDRIVTGRGKLITTSPTIVVQTLETSLINALKVRAGQVVRKGEVLAVLDPTFTQADVSNLKARLASLTAQINRLRTELDGRDLRLKAGANADERLQKMLFDTRRANYQATLKSYQKKRDSLRAAMATNQADQKVLAKRVNALKQIESMHRRLLQRGSGARAKVLEAENLRLEVQRDMEMAINKQREIRNQLEQVQAEILAFKKSWSQKTTEELVKATGERESVIQQLVKARKRRERVMLKSPAHAMVQEVAKRSVGSVVREGETLVTLVPLDVPIEAEVKIQAKDVGFIRKGDEVRIKFDAFPFQRHGTVKGKVRVISGDVFRRGQGGERASPDEPEVYYLVLVTLPRVKLRAVPADFRLIPGMTLTAEIKVGTRTVISYLIYPLIKAFDESIREP